MHHFILFISESLMCFKIAHFWRPSLTVPASRGHCPPVVLTRVIFFFLDPPPHTHIHTHTPLPPSLHLHPMEYLAMALFSQGGYAAGTLRLETSSVKFLQCRGQHPTNNTYLAPNANSAKVEKL